MKNVIFFILIIFIIGLISCNTNQKKPPMAKQGILDLRNWDFEKDGNVRLDGDWEFYWHEFLSSKDFDTVQQKHYIKVPKPWNDYKWGNQELDYEGYATYCLRIIVNKNTKNFGLKFPDQGTAFELYLNDSLVGKNGKIEKTRVTSEPQYKPLLIPFLCEKDTITLVCQVSNYDFHFGGIYFASLLGNENEIRGIYKSEYLSDYRTILANSIIFLILLLFFVFMPKDKVSLLFACFTVLGIIRNLTVKERIINEWFPFISWEWCIKLEGISWFIGMALISVSLRLLFKNEVSKIITYIYCSYFTIITLITLIFTSRINSLLIPYAEMGLAIGYIYFIIMIIIAFKHKRKEAKIIFLGNFAFFSAAMNESLYYSLNVPLILEGTEALVLLNFSWIILLASRFKINFNRVENFANELKIEVEVKTKDLREEKEKSEKLLLNVLPEQIATRLKSGETTIADHFEEASVIFIDIADFTKLSAKSSPQMMVKMLNEIFTIFDKIAAKYGLEKIKTIGDCYMAAAGIPVPRKDHAEAIAMMALDVMSTMKEYRSEEGHEIKFRIGLDCGPIVAGVIGEQKFIYDLWGDMVNTASRMETNGIIGKIQVTERFKNKLTIDNLQLTIGETRTSNTEHRTTIFEERGEIEIKGKGKMRTWFLMIIDN